MSFPIWIPFVREKFLELFSQAYPNELHIIQLENGPSHQAKDLVIPENIILLFQPSHCPQVNPIERRRFEGGIFQRGSLWGSDPQANSAPKGTRAVVSH